MAKMMIKKGTKLQKMEKKVTIPKKIATPKDKKPTALQVQQLHELVKATKHRHWALPRFLTELRKLGVVELETCIHCAYSWFTWEDGAVLEHAYKSFKPYLVSSKIQKEKAKHLVEYAHKEPMDYLQLFTNMADAGAHKLMVNLKTGKVGFYHFTDKGVKKLVAAFSVDLKPGALKHPHYDELMQTFIKSGTESWPHSRLYGEIARLGLDAFDFDFGPMLSTFWWNDGTKDFYDESANITSKIKVAPKLDKKKLAALLKDYKANKIEYSDFLDHLSKAGVKRYVTSVKSEKIIYQGKDLKNTVEEKIELN